MPNPIDPPINTSIFEYPPSFPNGQVNDAWAAYFQSLNSAIVGGSVLSFNTRTGAVVPVSGDYPASLIPFTQAGTGAVAETVDTKLKQVINAADWGVKADGVTDDTAAMQAALNAMIPTTTGSLNSAVGNYILNLPKGTILLSATVAGANSLSQFEMVGQGKRATVFKWTGAASIPVFKFTNCREAVFRDFGIVGNASTPPSYGIQIDRNGAWVGAGAPTACQFHNIWCGGDSASMLTTGIGYTASSLTYDTNNDLGLFVGCQFSNCASYGVSFEHGNSLLHKLVSCGFSNCLGAAINNINTLGSAINGSFDAFDCYSSGCAYTWRLGGSSHSISIFGWKSEQDTNILSVPSTVGTTYTLNLTMNGVSWVGNSGTALLTFDAGVGSTMLIQGGRWTAPTGVALSFPTTGSMVRIEGSSFNMASITYNNEVDMVDNYVAASTPTLTNSGSGVLRMVRSDGSGRVNTLPTITSGTSFSASGLSNSLIILNYASGTTLSSITNGYPGQILTLRAINGNATISYGTSADQIRLVGGPATSFTLMSSQQITLQRMDSSNGNTWVEIARSSPNQIYDATSGAFLYSGRIAGAGALSQWGPINSTTTSATFGAGAVASSLGSYTETLSTGAINFYKTGGVKVAGFDATGNFIPSFYKGTTTGTAVASAATITPTGQIFHITGTTTVNTINLPYTGFTGTLLLVTDAALSFGTSGNIATALTTAAGQNVLATYDGTKWNLLSVNIGAISNSTYIPQGTTAGTVDYTAATDSTAHLQSITDASVQATTLLTATGTPKFNEIIRDNGVVLKGSGMAQLTGGATAYWQPTTTSLPVVQISDDLANYNGSGVKDSLIYTPSGTGQKGLVFAGGSAKCYAKNIMSLGFTTSCIEFRNDDVNPCTFNTVENVTANTNVLGARGIAFIDTHVAGTGWTTANQVTNFNATAPNGYPIYCESAQTNSLSNGYIQTSYSGHGLYFKKTATQVWTPRLNFSNVDVDNVSGYGGVSVVFDIDSGSNYRSASNVSNLTPIMGDLNSAGNAYWIAGHTTLAANFTVGATTVTLTSVTGLESGMNIMIPGAGTAGRNYMDRIVSINTGTKVVTLDQHNSATQVNSGGDVSWGDFVNAINTRGVIGNFSNRAIVVGASNKIGLTGDGAGLIYQSNGNGQGYWSSGDYMTEWKDKQLRFLGSVSSPTVTAISRVGTTVTVTTSSAHKMGVGDPFTLSGIVDFDGFNSTTQWQPVVASVGSATTFTYTSLVSGSNTPANQAPTLVPYRGMHFNRGRLEFDNGTGSGIGFKIAAGTMGAAIFTDNINPTLNIWTPDTTNGTYDFRWGSGISTGKAMRIGNNSVGDRAYLTGNGAFWLLNAAAPATDAGGSFIYSSSADGKMHVRDNAGNDGAVLNAFQARNTGGTAAPTGTTSTAGVMMGMTITATPTTTGRFLVILSGQMANSTINDGATVNLRYGTGAAPTNGAALTGTIIGAAQTHTSLVAADTSGFCVHAIVSGLTNGTAYWLDASLAAVTGGTATITGAAISVVEI